MSYISISGKTATTTATITTTKTSTARPRRSVTDITDQFHVGKRKPSGSGGGGGGSKTASGLMKYLPWAAGALGLLVVVKIATSGSKKTGSSAAA